MTRYIKQSLKCAGWLGIQNDQRLLPFLRQKGYTVKFLENIKQIQSLSEQLDCLIYYVSDSNLTLENMNGCANCGLPLVLYEPRSFTHYMAGHDIRFAKLAELAQQSAAVICGDELSGQWWSQFNENTFLLSGDNLQKIKMEPNPMHKRIAGMLADDYLAGCVYAVKHRVGLIGKVKRYYKEFGLRQTLHRVYEKLTGRED